MQAEEEKHMAEFERLMTAHRARPTVLMPLWDLAGFALGIFSFFLAHLSQRLIGELIVQAGILHPSVSNIFKGHLLKP